MLPLRCSRLRDSISNDSSTPSLMIATRLSSEWVTLISMIFGIKAPPAASRDGGHAPVARAVDAGERVTTHGALSPAGDGSASNKGGTDASSGGRVRNVSGRK